MLSAETVKEIDHLPLSEKLLLVEEIWDSIARDNEQPPFPKWHKNELNARYQAYQDGSVKLRDWQSVHDDLRRRFQ